MEKGEETTRLTQVVIAALNEEDGIGLTIGELATHLDEPRVIVVDGWSGCFRTLSGHILKVEFLCRSKNESSTS